MVKRRHETALLVAAILAGAGCAREVTIDLPEMDPKLVVISHFESGKSFSVRVTKSQRLDEVGAAEVPLEMDIRLLRNGEFIDQLYNEVNRDDKKLYWVSKNLAETGQTYEINIQGVGDLPGIHAQSYVPRHVRIEPIEVDLENDAKEITLNDGSKALRVPIALHPVELPANDRFFAFNLQHEIDVVSYENGTPLLDYTKTDNSIFQTDGRTSALLYNTPESVTLVDEEFWNTNDPVLRLNVLVPFDPGNELPRRIMVEWRTLSKEYYRYHLSLARQGNNLPLSDPDALYNNIEGGYGNFSGYSGSIDTVLILR